MLRNFVMVNGVSSSLFGESWRHVSLNDRFPAK
jgi:hypothetical protein